MTPPKRPPTHRDHRSLHTPPEGVVSQIAGVVEVEVDEECTGRISDPDALAAARKKRPTEERVERLETKVDTLTATVARIDGKLDVVPRLVDLLEKVVGGDVAGKNAKLTASLAIGTAQATDQIEANKTKREILKSAATKLLAGLGLAATAILAALQARSC